MMSTSAEEKAENVELTGTAGGIRDDKIDPDSKKSLKSPRKSRKNRKSSSQRSPRVSPRVASGSETDETNKEETTGSSSLPVKVLSTTTSNSNSVNDLQVPGLNETLLWTKPTVLPGKDLPFFVRYPAEFWCFLVIFSPCLLAFGAVCLAFFVLMVPLYLLSLCCSRGMNPEKPPVSIEDVQRYIAFHRWPYGSLFDNFDGHAFMDLSHERLIELGVSEPEHRETILFDIAGWKSVLYDVALDFANCASQQLHATVLVPVEGSTSIRNSQMAQAIDSLMNDEIVNWQRYCHYEGKSYIEGDGEIFPKVLYHGHVLSGDRLMPWLIDNHHLIKNILWAMFERKKLETGEETHVLMQSKLQNGDLWKDIYASTIGCFYASDAPDTDSSVPARRKRVRRWQLGGREEPAVDSQLHQLLVNAEQRYNEYFHQTDGGDANIIVSAAYNARARRVQRGEIDSVTVVDGVSAVYLEGLGWVSPGNPNYPATGARVVGNRVQ